MEFLDKKIEDYVLAHSSTESELLQKIDRHTHLNVMMPRMLSGHLQGRVLAMLSSMIRPKAILEIGTYTGYATLCMAEGLDKKGVLHTIDINEELEETVQGFFDESIYKEHIHYHIGNALEVIPTLAHSFDLVFIDADKANYQHYYDLVFDKVNKGGIIIADNVLWSGKVIEEYRKKLDKDTQAILEFNDFVQHDDRVENVLFPIRDGLMVVRKK